MHAEGLNRVGRIVYGCAYCAHRVHSAEQVFGDTDGETDGLAVDVGDQDFRGGENAFNHQIQNEESKFFAQGGSPSPWSKTPSVAVS